MDRFWIDDAAVWLLGALTPMLLAFALALLIATALVAIGTVHLKRREDPRARRLARVCLMLGSTVGAFGVVGASAGLIQTIAAVSAPGLLESDVDRMWQNGLTEAAYNLVPAFLIGLPVVLVARWAARTE